MEPEDSLLFLQESANDPCSEESESSPRSLIFFLLK
jgi:hypothetical protein